MTPTFAHPITGATKICALIGSPVGHSFSPTLHNAGFAQHGLDLRYVAFDVAAGQAGAAIEAVRALGIVGMSVTMPHKFDVAKAVDRLTPQAVALESCNTVFRDPDDATVLWGDSTDGDGFVAGLASIGVAVQGAHVGVIGAGGAGRAVVEALGRHGAASVLIANRDPRKAASAATLAAVARTATHQEIATQPRFDLLVNATSVGMRADDPLPCPEELLQRCAVVADLIYHPHRTALLDAAHRVGAITMNGLPMLLNQAALQFQRWTGIAVHPDVLQAAMDERLRQAS